MMSYWMQSLDLRCQNRFIEQSTFCSPMTSVNAKKNINEESALVEQMAWRQAKSYSLL